MDMSHESCEWGSSGDVVRRVSEPLAGLLSKLELGKVSYIKNDYVRTKPNTRGPATSELDCHLQ